MSPNSVWYALVLLLFSATAKTDTGSKTFDCAFVSTLEVYDNPDDCNYWNYCYCCCCCHYNILSYFSDIIVIFDVIVIMLIIELIDCI